MRRMGLLVAMLLGRADRADRGGGLAERLRQRRGLTDRGGLGEASQAGEAAGSPSPPAPLPPGAVAHLDLAYGSDPAQRLDVYSPAAAAGAPLVLFVHGGGWRNGDKAMDRMLAHKLPHWLGKGCVFVSTNYRMLPAADVLTQADDVAGALAFVQANAAAWGADARRVVLLGHSAGAHLVALLTADEAVARRQGAQAWLATVALDSAALDMVAVMNRPHYRFYDPVFGQDPAFWRAASPLHRLQKALAAPTLLVCSTLRADSEPPARAFAQQAQPLGGRVQVLPVALDHRALNEQLGEPGAYTAAVDAFLKTVGLP